MKVRLRIEKKIKKLNEFRTYIVGHWEFIKDWRKRTEQSPEGARRLGGMESNQRKISFRMKKRGMHWSKEGAEAMVKVKQGMLNKTLREVYLGSQKRSNRHQRKVKQTVCISQILRQPTQLSIGAKQGRISLHIAHSTAMGRLVKGFR